MKFEVTILGSSAALPAYNRLPSSQILNIDDKLFLIDCGEGTQMQISKLKIKHSKIQHIFISHLHGDHYLGIFGLISTMGLLGRTQDLHIHSPKGLSEMIISFLRLSCIEVQQLSYKLHFHTFDPSQCITLMKNKTVKVTSIPLKHTLPTSGFLFRERQRPRTMLKDKIEEYDIPYNQIPNIKNGADFITNDGKTISNTTLTKAPPTSRSYAYCSDTSYTKSILPIIKGVDLLFHESTFGDDIPIEKVRKKGHSTAKEAAQMAKSAEVGKLIIGHFSSRYVQLDGLQKQAQSIFQNTELAVEGKTIVCPLAKN